MVFGIDAETVGGGVLDEGLGVDGAGEMHVKIAALGHAREEGAEFERALLALRRRRGWRAARCGVAAGAEILAEQGWLPGESTSARVQR